MPRKGQTVGWISSSLFRRLVGLKVVRTKAELGFRFCVGPGYPHRPPEAKYSVGRILSSLFRRLVGLKAVRIKAELGHVLGIFLPHAEGFGVRNPSSAFALAWLSPQTSRLI